LAHNNEGERPEENAPMTPILRIQFLLPALIAGAMTAVMTLQPRAAAAQATPRPSVFQTTLEEANQLTPEITTEELQAILAANIVPVFDVRTAKEYAIAHIPGTVNIYEKEVERIVELYPNRSAAMILYCNGPSCGKSKRTSEQLVALGYTNVRRYQLGIPVWRALSQTVQTDLPGVLYIYGGDKTAVWVDARTPAEFAAGSIPGAVNVQKGEATAANDDGRLPFQDKGTRIVVIGATVQQARIVAAEIAKKAYLNSSYFGGTFNDLRASGLINRRPVVITKNAVLPAGAACSAIVRASDVDNGSYDPDAGDTVALAVDPAGPLGPGQLTVTVTGTDSHGASATGSAIVTVADTMAPTIAGIEVQTESQRVMHHRTLLVTVDYAVADNCGAVTAELKVTSRDPGDRGWRVLDAHHVLFSAGGHEWDSHDDTPRRYSMAIVATDAAGNQTVQTVTTRGRE
jgi:rhodanese-related sulfurtransferase